MLYEISIALRKAPQPQALRAHQRGMMLLLSLCLSLLVGWSLVIVIGGRHYVILAFAIFPLFVLLKISGLLLRGSLMPSPARQT